MYSLLMKRILPICLLLGLMAATAVPFGTGCEDEERLNPQLPRLEVDIIDRQGQVTQGCELTPCTLNFSLIALGATSVRQVVLRNAGDNYLDLLGMEIEPGAGSFETTFTILDSTLWKINPGETKTVEISYAPMEESESLAVFHLESTDPEHPLVDIDMFGWGEIGTSPQLVVCLEVDPSDPQNDELSCAPPWQVDFGDVPLPPEGQPVSTPIIMRNMGREELAISEVRVTADSTREFVLQPDDLTALVPPIEADGTPHEVSVTLWYNPRDGGRDEGAVEIKSNDPEDQTTLVQLAAGGLAPRVCLEPLLLDFDKVVLGYDAQQSFLVINCGLETLTVDSITLDPQSNPAFTLVSPPACPCQLEPQEQLEVVVHFEPNDLGIDDGRVFVESNDPSTATAFVMLRGQGGDDPVCDIGVYPHRLNFGMVAAGSSADKTLVLSNNGTLQCQIQEISVPSGPFVFASVQVTPFPLEPGDQRLVALRYQPTDAGPHRATVEIHSTDFEEPVISVDLYGNDPDVPECDIEITPGDLAFGMLPVWSTDIQTVEVRNRGTEPCVIEELRFDSRTDQVFALEQAPALPASIPVGDFISLQVSFTPTSKGTFDGGLIMLTNDPDTPVAVVTMSGAADELNLVTSPDSLDFGAVTIGCSSPELTVTLFNTGSATVDVQDIYLDPAQTDPGFIIEAIDYDGQSTLPIQLPGADSMEIRLRYTPSAEEANSGVLVIETSAALGSSMYVPLTGAGTYISTQVDVFQQLDQAVVDVLWVVDNSGSMSPQQDMLARNFSAFIYWAVTLETDFQIGVITTEINEPNLPGDYFDIYPGILVHAPRYPKILTNDTPDLEQAFATNVKVGTCCSDEQEAGLHAAMLALSDPLVSAPAANGGFLREDAKLLIIMVSDEEDQSPGEVDFYVDFFKSIKGYHNDQLMDVSVIVGDKDTGCGGMGGINAQASNRYIFVQEATGGIFRSHCFFDWGTTLSELGLDAFAARTQFALTRQANPASIQVEVDDGSGPVVIPEDVDQSGDGWIYDVPSNSVVFGDQVVPPRGASITIGYDTTCL
jgi:hypothetical protein